jgi:hypothetical protein
MFGDLEKKKLEKRFDEIRNVVFQSFVNDFNTFEDYINMIIENVHALIESKNN